MKKQKLTYTVLSGLINWNFYNFLKNCFAKKKMYIFSSPVGFWEDNLLIHSTNGYILIRSTNVTNTRKNVQKIHTRILFPCLKLKYENNLISRLSKLTYIIVM